MSSVERIARKGRFVVVLLMSVVTLFPPLVCPETHLYGGEFSWRGSRGRLLSPGPMVYWYYDGYGNMKRSRITQIDLPRMLTELAFLGSLGLICLMLCCGARDEEMTAESPTLRL